MTRVIFSIVLEFMPLFFVYLWLENKTNWSTISICGCSLMASAIVTYIGVMCFDLKVIGRYSMLEGGEALTSIGWISVFGAGLTLIGLTLVKENK